MPSTTLQSVSYPAARELRALAADRGQQRDAVSPGAQPSAADSLAPAVVNHVRPAGTAASQVDDAAVEAEGTPTPAGEHSEPARSAAKSGKADSDVDKARAEQISKLKARDAEVRAHEQAHAAVGGAFAGSPSYGFQRGPDGVSYAVSGEVPIDVSPIAGDPEATIAKMQQVKRAALAPQSPSGADQAIAAAADSTMAAARLELMQNVGKAAPEADAAKGTDVAASADASNAQAAGASTPGSDNTDALPPGEAARDLFSKLVHQSAAKNAYRSASTAAGSVNT